VQVFEKVEQRMGERIGKGMDRDHSVVGKVTTIFNRSLIKMNRSKALEWLNESAILL